jgi:hypothetical protein
MAKGCQPFAIPFVHMQRLEKRKNVAEEPGQSEQPPQQPARKTTRVPLEVQEQKLTPQPSLWPIVLALALVITAIGAMIVNINAILFVCGIVVTIVVIVGWILEKH